MTANPVAAYQRMQAMMNLANLFAGHAPLMPSGARQAIRSHSKHAAGYTTSPRPVRELKREAKTKRQRAERDRAAVRRKFGRNRIH